MSQKDGLQKVRFEALVEARDGEGSPMQNIRRQLNGMRQFAVPVIDDHQSSSTIILARSCEGKSCNLGLRERKRPGLWEPARRAADPLARRRNFDTT